MSSKRSLALAILLVLSCSSVTQAITLTFGGGSWGRPTVGVGGYPGFMHRRPMTYEERYYWSNNLYPKYYGGFHANYFQSIGLPPGDIGLRSYGIHPTPW